MAFYGTSKCDGLIALLCVYVLQFLIFTPDAESYSLVHFCPNTTTYNQNSTYQTNLSNLLSSLSSNSTSKNLFFNGSAGHNGPDSAYGLFMCRGDVTPDVCHECVETASVEVIENCPKRKEAYIWYDECMLRYSNRSFFSTMSIQPSWFMYNTLNDTDSSLFLQVLEYTINDLATRVSNDQSANGQRMKGFGTWETSFPSFKTLYSLVQCTPDLSGSDCKRCLSEAIKELPNCCTGKRGGRVYFPSCYIRYENYPFYGSRASAAPSPLPTLSPPAASDSSTTSGDGALPIRVIVSVIVSVVISVVLFSMAFCFLRRRAKKKYKVIQKTTDGEDEKEISVAAESLQYDLSTIEAATNNFSIANKIGVGGFGDVFKGTLATGQEIAVKRLSKRSSQGAQEFKNEVVLVAKLQHRNLVRLLGFCLEGEEKILIYEFVPNKSLDYLLFDPDMQESLDWSRRCKIVNQIAKGILYLHEDSRLRIIHRDLKASNVLLDKDMNPKISDFGMARLVGVDQTEGNTNRIVGTFGYMSPEYAMHGQFSVKSDVFSFGVLVLEIVSGRKNNSFYQGGSLGDLLSFAWKLWRDGTPLELVDPNLGVSSSTDEVLRCIHIGLLCVQEDAEDRPTVASVMMMLSSNSVNLPLPNQPAFFVRSRTTMNMQKQPHSDESSVSANEVSITEMNPR